MAHPVTIEETRMGAGVMGATLKRLRMPASRSTTARIPPPKKPLPRTPSTSTIEMTWAALPEDLAASKPSPKAKKKMIGKR